MASETTIPCSSCGHRNPRFAPTYTGCTAPLTAYDPHSASMDSASSDDQATGSAGVDDSDHIAASEETNGTFAAYVGPAAEPPAEEDIPIIGEWCNHFVQNKSSLRLNALLDAGSMTIGVAGSRGVGKSALVRNAFRRINVGRWEKRFVGFDSGGRGPSNQMAYVLGIPDYSYEPLKKLIFKWSLFLVLAPIIFPMIGDFLRWVLDPS